MEQIIIQKGTQFLLDNRSFEIDMESEKDTYTVFDMEFPAVKKIFTREKIEELLQKGKLQLKKEVSNTERKNTKEFPIGKPLLNSVVDVYTGYPMEFNVESQPNLDKENIIRHENEKFHFPLKSTVLRRVREKDGKESAKQREFILAEKYNHLDSPVIPTYPLQRAIVEYTKLDLFVVDDKNGHPIGRPWITSIVDVYSGYPLGFYIGFEPPSYVTVMNALNHAIFQKTYIKKAYPILQNHWVAHGLPEVLEVDRGKEFSSKRFAGACERLHIKLVHSSAKKTWYSGAVERNFRQLNQILLSRKKWSSISNLFDKEENGRVNHEIIRYSELLECVHKWVVDLYAFDFNKDVNGIPVKLWESSIKNTPNSRILSSNFDVKLALMNLEKGRIALTGIRYKHLFYQSEKLIKLLRQINAKGLINSVAFKYDPTDMSKIFVHDPIDSYYFEVLCTDQEYTNGLNEYVHQEIVKRSIEGMKKFDKEALLSARNELEQMMIESKGKLLMAERKKAMRMKGIGSESSSKLIPKFKRNYLPKVSKEYVNIDWKREVDE